MCARLFLLLPLFVCTSYCDQKYTFIGVTRGDYSTSIWILEDVGGECGYTDLQEVILDSTGGHRVEHTSSSDSTAMRTFLKTVLVPVEFTKFARDEKGIFSNGKITVAAPPGDTAIENEFYRLGSSAWEWNTRKGSKGMVLPKCTGTQPTLTYAAPRGFYSGYVITDVWYVEEDKLLIVFTQQSTRGLGMDTMHGYFVLQI